MKRVLCASNLPRRVPNRIVYAESVAACLASDEVFVDPKPSLAAFTAQIAALEAAEPAAFGGGVAATSDRNACLRAVEHSLDGKTWTTAALTTRADHLLDGLTPATRYFFPVRVRVKGVVHDWSDVFELLLV